MKNCKRIAGRLFFWVESFNTIYSADTQKTILQKQGKYVRTFKVKNQHYVPGSKDMYTKNKYFWHVYATLG